MCWLKFRSMFPLLFLIIESPFEKCIPFYVNSAENLRYLNSTWAEVQLYHSSFVGPVAFISEDLDFLIYKGVNGTNFRSLSRSDSKTTKSCTTTQVEKDFNSILIPESNSVIVKFLKNAAIVKTVSSICKFIWKSLDLGRHIKISSFKLVLLVSLDAQHQSTRR